MTGVRVLGSLTVEDGGAAVDLGGPLQRAVLALLLIERGRVVSVDRLIDQLWRSEPPPRAITSLQAYVSNLRRVLEPGRARRAPARILVSEPPGYALRLPSDAVDAWRFEALLTAAWEAAPAQPPRARDQLSRALALWRGPAYAEFADEEWAAAEVARLSELRVAAQESAVAMALRTGSAAEAAAAAEPLVREHPLREESWRLRALALWASERQADALATLRQARTVLREELGLDPGAALTELEAAILGQRQDVLHRALAVPGAVPSAAAPSRLSAPAPAASHPLIGRERELSELTSAAAAARSHGGVVLLTGEAGAGKSALLGEASRLLAADGWIVAAGSCPEASGAPPAWGWTEALRALAGDIPPPPEAAEAGSLLGADGMAAAADASAARFRLHRAVATWLRAAVGTGPVAVILDDLHYGDAETTALLAAVAQDLPGCPLLLVGAYRPEDATPELAQALAVLARRSPVRVALGGLPVADAATLIASVHGGRVDPLVVETLAERTGGNPFYLRESARLLASEGALVAVAEVPEGVRDVLRRRLARLPAPVVAVLRLAAVVGRDADVEVLVEAADTDEATVVDALEAGVIAGLLTEPAPGQVRFVHALVRDTVYADLTQLRLTRMHARVAAAIRRHRPDDVTALAYHYARAASAGPAEAAVDYSISAAELADRRLAYDSAVSLLEQAVEASARAPATERQRAERHVDLLGRLLRAQLRAGRVAAARVTRQRAADLAAAAGREDLVAAAFAAWSEPTPWQTRPYGFVDGPAVAALERQLARADLDEVTRCRLLSSFAEELYGEDDPRPARAAAEALTIARRLGDRRLLAQALAAATSALDFEREPGRRASLAAELAVVAGELELPGYAWVAEHRAAGAAATRGRVGEFRRHLAAGQRLADQYEMAEAQTAQVSARAMLAHIEGRLAEARELYDQTAALMAATGSMHAGALHRVALLTVAFSDSPLAAAEPLARELHETLGPLAADAWAATLAAGGRVTEARRARQDAPPLRVDFFRTIFGTFRAAAVIGTGDQPAARALLADLAATPEMIAGAASASLAMQPVALTLGELSAFLGCPREAAGYFRTALRVARAWNAPRWAARAEAALAGVADEGAADA